jgi:UDP-N-acetylglucosamine 2-epimerase
MLVVSTHPSDHRHTNALKAALGDIEAPGWAVVFGDRRDMLEAALELHYEGTKLVHVGGGDTPHHTNGHPDHATRDAISMLATKHCVANEYARQNLLDLGLWGGGSKMHPGNIHVTGSPGLDEVVAYAKTLDPNRKREGVFEWMPELPSNWAGRWSGTLTQNWVAAGQPRLPQADFLHKLAHCALFRSNSSAALYEAPILGTPVELVGDRQAGRRGPYHHPEGRACETIRKVIENVCVHRS